MTSSDAVTLAELDASLAELQDDLQAIALTQLRGPDPLRARKSRIVAAAAILRLRSDVWDLAPELTPERHIVELADPSPGFVEADELLVVDEPIDAGAGVPMSEHFSLTPVEQHERLCDARLRLVELAHVAAACERAGTPGLAVRRILLALEVVDEASCELWGVEPELGVEHADAVFAAVVEPLGVLLEQSRPEDGQAIVRRVLAFAPDPLRAAVDEGQPASAILTTVRAWLASPPDWIDWRRAVSLALESRHGWRRRRAARELVARGGPDLPEGDARRTELERWREREGLPTPVCWYEREPPSFGDW